MSNVEKKYTCCNIPILPRGGCPLIPFCRAYNVEVDRGPSCEVYENIKQRIKEVDVCWSYETNGS